MYGVYSTHEWVDYNLLFFQCSYIPHCLSSKAENTAAVKDYVLQYCNGRNAFTCFYNPQQSAQVILNHRFHLSHIVNGLLCPSLGIAGSISSLIVINRFCKSSWDWHADMHCFCGTDFTPGKVFLCHWLDYMKQTEIQVLIFWLEYSQILRHLLNNALHFVVTPSWQKNLWFCCYVVFSHKKSCLLCFTISIRNRPEHKWLWLFGQNIFVAQRQFYV